MNTTEEWVNHSKVTKRYVQAMQCKSIKQEKRRSAERAVRFHIGKKLEWLFCEDLFIYFTLTLGASPIAQLVKNLPAMQENPVQFLAQEDPLEKR